MDGAEAILFQHLEMPSGAVSLMLREPVKREAAVIAYHKAIARDFGYDRGRRN